jgi:hypothetical protein
MAKMMDGPSPQQEEGSVSQQQEVRASAAVYAGKGRFVCLFVRSSLTRASWLSVAPSVWHTRKDKQAFTKIICIDKNSPDDFRHVELDASVHLY